jgi:hypothetical protein
MEGQRAIALIGDSILMEGVKLRLETCREWTVVQIDPARSDLRSTLRRLAPALIITELDAPWGDALFTLLRDEPDLQLIGLDPTQGRLIVLTGRHYASRTLQDLLQLVQEQVGRNEAAATVGGPG